MNRHCMVRVLLILVVSAFAAPRDAAADASNLAKVTVGNTQLAVDFYQRLAANEGNFVFSPLSISTALALTYAGARGETAGQIAGVLHFSGEDSALLTAFSEIQARLDAVGKKAKVQLGLANALWPQKRYPLRKEYLELARKHFRAEITPVDYGDGEAVRRRINSWAERETGNRITDLLEKAPDPSTRLILANAVFFKGTWVSRFKSSDTKPMPFHSGGEETVEVPMMSQASAFRYGEDAAVQLLEMPYAGKDLAMVIALPRRKDGLQSLEGSLTGAGLEEGVRNMWKGNVEVSLPRFGMTTGFGLDEMLKAMGMSAAFDPDRADFSGMDGKATWLYVGSAAHKAFIEVNEEGTEAAAVTHGGGCFPAGTEVLTSGGPRPIETVEAGTEVYACDLSAGQWVLAKVLKRRASGFEGDMIEVRAGGITLRATGNHPFYVLRGERLYVRPLPLDVPEEEWSGPGLGRWVEARAIRVGDVLKAKDGAGLTVSTVSSGHEEAEVYNLDVEGHHNYGMGRSGILVHNKGGSESGPRKFLADHPFLFLIRDSLTGSILFMGRVTNPERK